MGRSNAKIVVDPKRLRRYDINVFCCNNSLLRKLTGWVPQVGFEDGLQRTIEWFREHGRRWSWEEFVDETVMYRGRTRERANQGREAMALRNGRGRRLGR